jgi:hypothetical protein
MRLNARRQVGAPPGVRLREKWVEEVGRRSGSKKWVGEVGQPELIPFRGEMGQPELIPFR